MTTAQITTENLTSILSGLFEGESTCNQIESPVPVTNPRSVGTYNDCEGNFLFALTCDLSVANGLGAALAMIPPGGAEDATDEGVVPDNIGENLYEVLNICSAVFADYHGQRIVLDKVYNPGDAIEDEVAAKIEAAGCLIQVEYGVQRYQSGNISLLKIN